jgi:hypothetical protein
MARWTYALALLLLQAVGTFGQTTTLTANFNPVTAGPDLPGFSRATYFTFDLRGTTTAPAFWTGTEIELDVLRPGGRIFQSAGQRDPDNDANTPIGDSATDNDLFPPSNPQPPANDTRRYDTYMVAPGPNGIVETPLFAAPGGVIDGDANHPTRIRGLNPQGEEIPLAWFSLGQTTLNNSLLARFTFVSADDLSLTQDVAHPNVYATLSGRTTSSTNPQGTPFSFLVFAAPEPATLALLLLAGATGLGASCRR